MIKLSNYTPGGRVVADSNPVIPTTDYQGVTLNRSSFSFVRFKYGLNILYIILGSTLKLG